MLSKIFELEFRFTILHNSHFVFPALLFEVTIISPVKVISRDFRPGTRNIFVQCSNVRSFSANIRTHEQRFMKSGTEYAII